MARILVLLVLIISSCTIQKRHFTKGYAIEWKKDYASNSNDYSEAASEDPEPCDTIQNKDGSIVLASVQRIDSKKIYVVPCEGSSFTRDNINRLEVKTINYANGAIFENKTAEELQKEREANLEKYREDQAYLKKELKEKENLQKVQDDSISNNSKENISEEKKPSNEISVLDSNEESNEIETEPLMRGFFITGFAIAGLTLLLTLIDPFYGALSLIGLAVLFVTDVVSPFIVLASLIKKHRNKGKYIGRPVLLELLFALVSFGTLLLWIFLHF